MSDAFANLRAEGLALGALVGARALGERVRAFGPLAPGEAPPLADPASAWCVRVAWAAFMLAPRFDDNAWLNVMAMIPGGEALLPESFDPLFDYLERIAAPALERPFEDFRGELAAEIEPLARSLARARAQARGETPEIFTEVEAVPIADETPLRTLREQGAALLAERGKAELARRVRAFLDEEDPSVDEGDRVAVWCTRAAWCAWVLSRRVDPDASSVVPLLVPIEDERGPSTFDGLFDYLEGAIDPALLNPITDYRAELMGSVANLAAGLSASRSRWRG